MPKSEHLNAAKWAARLMVDNQRKFRIQLIAADNVIIREVKNDIVSAQAATTEPALLAALIIELI